MTFLIDDLRYRYRNGDQKVIDAMYRFADLADAARDMFESESYEGFSRLMDANFDLRASICDISPRNREMVECARSVGASAKFTGSGGAIIGTCENDDMFRALSKKLNTIKAEVIIPEIVW